MKKNRGVTLLVLAITIAVMLIIVGTITFNVNNINKTQELDKLYTDLNILRDKVNSYYLKYGSLPVSSEYQQISKIPVTELNPNDSGKYYVIDVSELQNLTLRTTGITFIINEETHTIYAPDGVTVEGITYYRLPEQYTLIDL